MLLWSLASCQDHLDLPVTQCSHSSMNSLINRPVRHSIVTNCLIDNPGDIYTVRVRHFPECSDDMSETCKLKGAGKVDSLVIMPIRPDSTGRASGEITKKRWIFLEPVIQEISRS